MEALCRGVLSEEGDWYDVLREVRNTGLQNPHTYTQVEWERSYYDCSGTFLKETMPKLWRLGAPGDVRLVYWFDS